MLILITIVVILVDIVDLEDGIEEVIGVVVVVVVVVVGGSRHIYYCHCYEVGRGIPYPIFIKISPCHSNTTQEICRLRVGKNCIFLISIIRISTKLIVKFLLRVR